MHSPSARAIRHLSRYCIVLVCTLKHVSPAKCVITIIIISAWSVGAIHSHVTISQQQAINFSNPNWLYFRGGCWSASPL